jgi:hypothetical protein
VIGTLNTGDAQIGLGIFGTNWSPADSWTADIVVTGMQLENVSGQSIQNIPAEYVSVGAIGTPWYGANVDGVAYYMGKLANTVAGNVVTNNPAGPNISTKTGGSPASCDAEGPVGFLLEPTQVVAAASPLSTESSFNSWTYKTNVTITEYNPEGPSGETLGAAMIENTVNDYHYMGHVNAGTLLRESRPGDGDAKPTDPDKPPEEIKPPDAIKPDEAPPFVIVAPPLFDSEVKPPNFRYGITPVEEDARPGSDLPAKPGDGEITLRDVIDTRASALTHDTVCQSCFFKAGNRSLPMLRIGGDGPAFCDMQFNLATGTASGYTTDAAKIALRGYGMIPLKDGWWRCWQIVSFIGTLPVNVSSNLFPYPSPYVGVAGQAAIYMFGHVIQGNICSYQYPPSYSQSNRGFDNLTYPPYSNFDPNGGTVYAEVKVNWAGVPLNGHRALFNWSGTWFLPGMYFHDSIADTGFAFGDAGVTCSVSGLQTLSANTAVRKFAASWGVASAQMRIAESGVAGNVSGLAAPMTYTATMGVGSVNSNISNMQGNIRNFKIWGRQATVGELISLTATR